MLRTLHILPLRVTAHSDRTSILSAYSRELGALAFAVPAGNGPGAARRRALLQPLTHLEVQASLRPGRDVHTFREPRPLQLLHEVMASPVRSALVMFMAEALLPVLRQGEADPLTFDFIVDAMSRLNRRDTPPANFHLTFMVRLAGLLGIAPDCGDYCPGRVFDMIDGVFRSSAPLHGRSLSVEESAVAAALLRIDWDNQGHFRFSRAERARALDRILEYYTLHYANLSALKSPSVLAALMGI